MEGRKRVKDQLMRIDQTYTPVHFNFSDLQGRKVEVRTLEETEYPNYYHKNIPIDEISVGQDVSEGTLVPKEKRADNSEETMTQLKEQHLTFSENQKGVSYERLFGDYLKGAKRIVITDPYIRLFYQVRNLMELLETLVKLKPQDVEVEVHLVTVADEFKGEQQLEHFTRIQDTAAAVGIVFNWMFDETGTMHARHIVTDHGWKISLDRGLDIFQQYDMNDAFSFSNRLQIFRPCKAFEVTFIKETE
jgi:ATP-dependent Lon protease